MIILGQSLTNVSSLASFFTVDLNGTRAFDEQPVVCDYRAFGKKTFETAKKGDLTIMPERFEKEFDLNTPERAAQAGAAENTVAVPSISSYYINLKIFSSKGDLELFRSSKRETTTVMNFCIGDHHKIRLLCKLSFFV
ncbi:unnamed protein product [Lactuca virosa]|uniref:Uncharacterized protein n=1 Tax=Lactuca virosa TaxID=75947 RepID=A0AAU9N621_9ASTR|nr:unnamed protein product [Lactuca virosa]